MESANREQPQMPETRGFTLADAIPVEQARVRALIVMYRDPLMKGAGEIGAHLMESALQAMDRAVMSGDLVEMIRNYQNLKSFTG